MNESEMVQWLFDVEQIKQLKHRYCGYCDQQYDPDGIASLFIDEGLWDGGPFGTYEGRDAIREFFAGASALISFANHYVTNPVIEIDGDDATGNWDLWQPMVSEPNSIACWLVAKYRDQYVRRSSGWLFRSLTVDVKALSPYEQGFGKQRFME